MKLPAPFEWCAIPAGEVALQDASPEGTTGGKYAVAAFHIAKYPITNAQYAAFVEAPDGYANSQWWDYAPSATRWRAANHEPKYTAFAGDALPRTNVTWFEAVAFCFWFSRQVGYPVILPTEQQWQRAAQGDDGREYPWGNRFDDKYCNTAENHIGQPTPVTKYTDGSSPYGVMDMSGNVFEWCVSIWGSHVSTDLSLVGLRALRGGCWDGLSLSAMVKHRARAMPATWSVHIGFRICTLE